MIKAPTIAGGTKKLVLGGINFGPLPPPTTHPGNVPPLRSVASELESLHNLHQSGALTDEEYSRAKARVLEVTASCNSNPNESMIPEAQAVAMGSEPSAYAEVIQDSEMAGVNIFLLTTTRAVVQSARKG
uniref:SHOCT domain-containing protein n=1 Tax=Pseudictyota dubia TaxID=2749911 RepID=A0A7R9W3R8_9STRA|mmetsp:Transcript_31137/g.57539  ORF Transcript_31137/g.57539 Transcript_31137/m.57539 type:complete len:130 (+) Transcript_31137:473-862(+)|eukprot:CAMPEP_0197459418 /NCGR_PEP_ID=MMETSP1175-20131217/51401_1 /TAXON_ID=1003142 /ORGANISM="Triceratium dubium, Strain CCMP147" /LENGTH=129 /DNA_ID=CAMNT_0042994291 /DNA_START=470 /DNA_END=859 /DNA_ORIENTATION=+